jgi:hypothetical protein
MNTPKNKAVAPHLGKYQGEGSDKNNKRRHLSTPQSMTPTATPNTDAERSASIRKRCGPSGASGARAAAVRDTAPTALPARCCAPQEGQARAQHAGAAVWRRRRRGARAG